MISFYRKISNVATMGAQIADLVIQKRSNANTGAASVCMLALKKLVPDKSLMILLYIYIEYMAKSESPRAYSMQRLL